MLQNQRDDTDLKRIVRILVSGGRWILWITLATTIFALVQALTTQSVYRAYTVLAPQSSADSSGLLNSLMGQVGGLASLVDFNTKENDPAAEAIALLGSRKFIEDFIVDRNLLATIERRSQSKYTHWPQYVSPNFTLWRGYNYFIKNILEIDKDKATSLVTVKIDWINREEAADWANDLVRRLNLKMRDRAIAEADKSISYLNLELDKTSILPLRESIYKLIEKDIKQKTLANVRNDYIFRVVDPAAVPDLKEKIRPWRAVYVITGVLSGLLLGVIALLARDFTRRAIAWYRRNPTSATE